MEKLDLYEVCLSYIMYCYLFYIMDLLIPFPPAKFVASLTPGESISGSIGCKDSS